jgi:HK97 family phage major capsid protein
MYKKRLLELIAKKEARKTELNTKAMTSEDASEIRAINTELITLNAEISEFRSMADAISDEPIAPVAPQSPPVTPTVATAIPSEPEGRSATPAIPQGQLSVLDTYGNGSIAVPNAQQRNASTLDEIVGIKDVTEMRTALFASTEYRNAYIKRLQKRSLNETEQRALTTAAGSGGDAVPTTTYDKIIAKLRQSSALFPLISDTYIPGNVKLPVANALNAAQWTAEATPVVSGDDTVTGVTLGGYILAKFASISIAAMIMTVDAFETYIVDQIGMQLSIAVESAILTGQGPLAVTPQPTGILPGVTWDDTNSTTWAAGADLCYDDLVGQRALLNSVYRPFAKWVINRKMEAMIMKIKSTTGFPIFSQDPQNGFAPKILNVDYVLDEYMPDNTILFGCPNYYYMNFSQAPIIAASTEAGFATSTILYRGMLIADGKPALSEAFTKLTQAA